MPTSYNVATISKLFGISERRVQQLARDGVIPKPEKNQYELVGCVRAYIDYLQKRAFGKGVAPQDTHLERARLIKAQADMAEIDLAIKTGSLVAVETIESDWSQMVSSCRSKLLAIPSKAAYQISGLEEVVEIEKFLKRTINDALSELADYEIYDTRDLSESIETNDDALDTATGTDGKPVGG